jgi:opacity protein-like surface antigen
MQSILSKLVLLAGAMTAATTAFAQHAPSGQVGRHNLGLEVGTTFVYEYSRVAEINGNRFWPFGGSVDGAVTLWKGFGVAADFSGIHATDISNGVSLNKHSFMAGPRYNFNLLPHNELRYHATRGFAEALFGEVHGFNSLFPAPNNVKTSATSFSMQVGGGVDVALGYGFNFRPVDVYWVHSSLPNNANNIQNNFRIGLGASFRK